MKFAFNKMKSMKFGIPKSVADFIHGRVPKRICARQCTKLLRQVDGHYKKYVAYLDKIRNAIK